MEKSYCIHKIKTNTSIIKIAILLLSFLSCNHSFDKTVVNEKKKINRVQFNSKFDSIIAIDFINYKYKTLDENYKIIIPSDDFQYSIAKNKYYKERIRNYSDSLSVALMFEFDDWKVANIVQHRLLFSWERLGYYLHKSESELREIAKALNIQHPYLVYSHFKHDNEQSRIKNKEMKRLRKMISEKAHISLEEVNQLTDDSVLDLCFRFHDEVIEGRKGQVKNHNH